MPNWTKEEPIKIGVSLKADMTTSNIENEIFVMVNVDVTEGKSPAIKIVGVYVGNTLLKVGDSVVIKIT